MSKQDFYSGVRSGKRDNIKLVSKIQPLVDEL